MQIHLAKPGGEREGPFSVAQIRQDLRAKKYADSDYWAWHDGLSEWMPLYKLLSLVELAPVVPAIPVPDKVEPATAVSKKLAATSPESVPVPSTTKPAPANGTVHMPSTPAVVEAPARVIEPQAVKAPVQPAVASHEVASVSTAPKQTVAAARRLATSGMPFSALDQACIFTTGDAAGIWGSAVAAQTVHEVTGEDLTTLRRNLPKDVISGCDAKGLLGKEGTISPSLWRTIAALRPSLIEQARNRFYRVCVRTFQIEAGALVTLVLFYNKDKLKAQA
jgi:hypothetical protein